MDVSAYIKKNGLLAYGLSVTVVTGVLFFIFSFQCGFPISLRVRTALCFTEAAFLCSPIWILRGKWRVAVPVFVSLLAIFLLANVLYLRYWNDLIPFYLITETASYNSLVFNAVPGLIRAADLSYILMPAVCWIEYVLLRVRRLPSLRIRTGIVAMLLCFVMYGCGMYVYAISGSRYNNSIGNEMSPAKWLRTHVFRLIESSRTDRWKNSGLFLYVIKTFMLQPSSHELTAEEEKEIAGYLGSLHESETLRADSIFEGNRKKNLILLIVESLNSEYIGRMASGRSITPVLDSLLSSEGMIGCLSIVPQIKDGSSSDGQMIYNCGVLPLREGAASMQYPRNTYPALACDTLFKETAEVIVEKGGIWNHAYTSVSYGYDRLLDNTPHDDVSMDEAVLARGCEVARNMKRPFMLLVSTLTMHTPFSDPNTPDVKWISVGGTTPVEARYMLAVHEFDRCLGLFIESLKQSGLWNETVLAIASDHDCNVESLAEASDKHGRIALLLLNTGHTEIIDRTVGQIDVFPTIRNVMGRKGGWNGLGMSILNSNLNSAVDGKGILHGRSDVRPDSLRKEAWRISDMMIRGNYFKDRSY